MVHGNFPPVGPSEWQGLWSLVSPRCDVPFFGKPLAPPGWQLAYADGRGSYYYLPPGERLNKSIWRYYYLVDGRTYHLKLSVESASTASASRFQVEVWARWRISGPMDFLRQPLEPAGHCWAMIMVILSDITRSVRPDSAALAQHLVDAKRGVEFTIGSGLVVWLDNVIVAPPKGFEELQVELERGEVQVNVDRLRQFRRNERRVDDFDFEAVQEETERTARRDRASAFLDRVDEGRRPAGLEDGRFRRRAELVATDGDHYAGASFDDDLVDETSTVGDEADEDGNGGDGGDRW
ncbi:hypothetical protein CcI49_04765 [Frankia sp. CcI49]|uniref:hypothetical protein n=1 Tax=Frankia sp. CcI49 TaxID=1745382 RepID=UPI0009CA51FF|nr:hypothetical protein [Frankia sp. CcI49]ONH61545.1 hypothetical protein CcI49_04765 [Frankia sp. CcI49]